MATPAPAPTSARDEVRPVVPNLIEVITHMAFSSGWPTSMTAARIAKGVFESRR